MMLPRLLLVLTALWLGSSSGWAITAAASDALPFRVGVAKQDITPDYPVMLSGYAARQGALTDRVEQPISARALVIEPATSESAGSEPVVLVSLELCGVPRSLSERIAAAVEERHSVARSHLAICATHTHSAPMVDDLLENIAGRELTAEEQQTIDRYTDSVVEKTIAAVDAAFRDRVPARLGWGTSSAQFAINRRSANGPVDHEVPILLARDAQDQPLAVVCSYACHCVTLGPVPFISGDWAGSAVEAIEADFPGATALVVIGCGADQNPNPAGATEQAVPRLHGQALADAVERRIDQPLKPVAAQLRVDFEEIELPLQTLPDRQEWERRAAGSGIEALHATKNLRRLDAGETLPTSIRYPIQTWTFGDSLAMTFLGGEAVAEYSLALKAKHGENLWVNAYANDVRCYIPSERVLEVGGYEGRSSMLWYDLPAPLAPGLEAKILAAVDRQLPDSYRAPHDPAKTGGKRPLSPADSMARMQTHDDLRVELVVAEPLVIDPVAIDFGGDGRLWVAEMRDYPEGLDGQYQPGGRIRVLEDTDGDGRYDHAETFLEGIPFPTGLMVWRNGLLVAAAPDVFFAEDTDGDGRADRRTDVLGGFATHNYQARVNSLSLGLDNWVHAAGGLFGGELKTPGGEVVDATNRDLRMLPDEGIVEPVTGRTQQGRVRDDWGNWFGCTNSVVLSHYPQTAHYLRRNPLLVPPPPERYVPRGDDSRQLFPRGELVQFSKSGPTGRPTSVCGLGIYRDVRLGSDFDGNAFVCEPVNQLVHRLVLERRGVTFEGHRAAEEQASEFLTSTDNWFRPVQVRTGPDGALWVVDMYRYVIEHPRFISDEVRRGLDIRSGDRQGRIYRIVPREPEESSPDAASPDAPSPTWPPTAGEPPTAAEWARHLASRNGTLRDMAHAELLWHSERERLEPSIVASIRQLASSSEHPQVRLQALCVLAALESLTAEDLFRGLGDDEPAVRAHAIRLTEQFAEQPPTGSPPNAPALALRLDQLIDQERDPLVRLQLAYTVGEWPKAERLEGLLRLLRRDAHRLDLRAAIFSGLRVDDLGDFAAVVLDQPAAANLQPAVDELISMVAVSGDKALIGRVLAEVLEQEGSKAQGQSDDPAVLDRRLALLPPLVQRLTPEDLKESPQTLASLEELRQASRERLADDELSAASLRATLAFAAAMLRWSAEEEDLEAIAELLAPWQSPDRQQSAIDALAAADSTAAHDALLAQWGELTPAMRGRAFNGLIARRSAAGRLVAALEAGTIRGAQLDAAQRRALSEHPDQAIRERAAAHASMATKESRKEILLQYQKIDPTGGDLSRGAKLFEEHCSACHRLNGVGREVGPDLAALSDRSTEFLLTEILDPNRAVDGRYATYVAVTDDGRMVSGILSAEQDTSITLKGQQAETTTVRRGEIAELINHGTSLMPEGLERVLPPEAMADLIAYLQAAPPTAVPYTYSGSVTPHASYPDAGGRLTDRQGGEARFDLPSWVGFAASGDPVTIELQIPAENRTEAIVLHYGVNHTPGGIHAPRRVVVHAANSSASIPAEQVFDSFDDHDDELGQYQIDPRSTRLEFSAPLAGPLRLHVFGSSGWVFLSEIEVVRAAAND
ncbi:neutral/alkaline non-lysosomal ceramidase N-terminal domain-containing protein [Candidatus Laterigemmans baculatus]|uniref:neutral/alkaline non-lysosomal ceramidase N-terminal domain-containing protein n=1 Tax=Candidatus Laterigemmans baculatus TaxID=2770505 RepID=UPI0013DC736B|nr:neutral/alkaline non-lysosomal ceramidase N-terminal domain-containing protein [Candidatus Laterigemmans baculatus]